ncbi:MAG: glycosyltransferase [bacterium]|nr:glycosyltransferase [bacterium]
MGRRWDALRRRLRTDGVRGTVQVVRWRVAERLGRALVGGRLDVLDQRMAANDTHVAVHAEALALHEARLLALGRDLFQQGAAQAERAEALAAAIARHADAQAATIAELRAGLAALAAGADATRTDLGALRDTVAFLERSATTLRELAHRHGRSIGWLAERQVADAPPPVPAVGPLVSIVLPVWNRATRIDDAIASVVAQTWAQWELLVVDDGSTDDTRAVVAGWAARDARIRAFEQRHAGHAVARNRGLAASRGEVIAYLDSDNRWAPGYLAAVVAAFADAAVASVYCAQRVHDHASDDDWIRAEPYDAEALRGGNFIDLNAYAHRRALYERLGGFDAGLRRLTDWDLVLRFARESPPRLLPVIGSRYEAGLPDQVSATESYAQHVHLVQRKLEAPLARPLRVLWAVRGWPQLSEASVRVEIDCMRRFGVEAAVWREQPGAVCFMHDAPVFDGALPAALQAFAPHVVHAHGLPWGLAQRAAAAAAGVPLTVRGHGSDFDPALVDGLLAEAIVAGVYLVPHQARRFAGEPRVRALAAAFDPTRNRPQGTKDPRLVVRCAAARRSEDLPAFLRIATRRPEQRFVLALARLPGVPGVVEEIAALGRSLGDPVALRIDCGHDEVAALLAEAGVYLHTHGLDEPYGQPQSIAEAMASGCFVLARACPESQAYVGDAGRLWATEDQAVACLAETASWDEAGWAAARLRAVDRAYARHVDRLALRPLLDDWLRLADAMERAA